MKKPTRVFIQMGPGGVGKTTVSAAYGLHWAMQGKKVLVMTIDPARRLAQALGIANNNGTVKVPIGNIKGELYATLLDHSAIFDSFILKMSNSQNQLAEKLFKNKLYQSLKNKLQGSQDFTALVELYNQASSGDYDIVILDTPPAQHAWQFLESPEKLSNLFREKVMRWFQWMGDPKGSVGLWNKIMITGTQKVMQALQILTGQEFMNQISDFFKAIQSFQVQLRDKIENAQKLLKSAQTEFTLVTTQDELKIRETIEYAKEIDSKGYHLKRIILNRAWPENNLDDISYLSTVDQAEIKKVFTLLSESQKINKALMNNWPKDVQILKIYDTLKSSHDLQRLQEMAQDIQESVK